MSFFSKMQNALANWMHPAFSVAVLSVIVDETT